MAIADKVVAIMNSIPGPVATSFRNDALVARVLRPLLNRFMPAGPTWIQVRSGTGQGLHLLIHPQNEKFYWTGQHEVPIQQAIANTLNPGMVFWDIGTHIGFFTLLASRCVGDSGQVHAFEPLDQNRQRLLAGIRKNGFTNITVHNCALAAASGEAIFYAHESSLMWTLVAERGGQEGRTVPCRTLDECAESIAPPDLIKIDAEGAETDVLRGGLRFLSTVRPKVIVEFSNDALLAEARALLPFYAFERLAPRHWAGAVRY